MKKLLALTLAAGMIAGVASGQTVLSQNAVGYIKTTVEPGELAMGSLPFLPLDGAASVSNVFGRTLPVDSRVWIWDPVEGSYDVEIFTTSSVGFPPVTVTNWSPNAATLSPGKAFWVSIPSSAGGSVDVTVMGEVPSDEDTDVSKFEGLTMLAFPYPAAMAVEDTAIGQNASLDDRIWLWNPASQSYDVVIYSTSSVGFPPVTVTNWAPANVVIPPGAGFWYQTSEVGALLTEDKPYDWP